MNSKAAIELSINFLVIILISLAVFGFGMYFIYDLAAGTNSIKDLTLKDIDNKIAALRCSNTEKICLTQDSLELKPKELGIIGLRVLNVGAEAEFTIQTEVKKYVYKNGSLQEPAPSDLSQRVDILPTERKELLKANEQKSFGIGFELTKKAKAGTYVVDVTIRKGSAQENYDGLTHKIYINVR